MALKLKYGFCVKCNDGIAKPIIGKRENALCEARHYWPEHKRSENGERQFKIYLKNRVPFLEARSVCEMQFEGCLTVATEVHHTRGRGEFLLAEDTWMAMCTLCHRKVGEKAASDYKFLTQIKS